MRGQRAPPGLSTTCGYGSSHQLLALHHHRSAPLITNEPSTTNHQLTGINHSPQMNHPLNHHFAMLPSVEPTCHQPSLTITSRTIDSRALQRCSPGIAAPKSCCISVGAKKLCLGCRLPQGATVGFSCGLNRWIYYEVRFNGPLDLP